MNYIGAKETERKNVDSISRDRVWDESVHWPESAECFTETIRVCGLSESVMIFL